MSELAARDGAGAEAASPVPPRGLWRWLVPSLAIHAVVLAALSLRSCEQAAAPAITDPAGALVNVETVDRRPTPPPPPPPPVSHLASRPGGGSHAHKAPPPRRAEAVAEKAEPTPESVVVTATDSPPTDGTTQASASPAPSGGDGEGQGNGHGRGNGDGDGDGSGNGNTDTDFDFDAPLPAITQPIIFGRGEPADFKGLVCFSQPGVLRVADIHGCTPVAVLYTNRFDIHGQTYNRGFPGISSRSIWFMIDYRGDFTVSQEGDYQLRVVSDDGIYLFVDDVLVVENDGKHEPTSKSGTVRLTAGRHRLKLFYAQTTGWVALQVYVTAPGAWIERLFSSKL